MYCARKYATEDSIVCATSTEEGHCDKLCVAHEESPKFAQKRLAGVRLLYDAVAAALCQQALKLSIDPTTMSFFVFALQVDY